MQIKRIVFVVGHENSGKSCTLRKLREICNAKGRRVTIDGIEFLIRSMSNDDQPESYMKFMKNMKRPAIIAALCPKFKQFEKPSNKAKTIDETLQLLRRNGYQLFFWIMGKPWSNKEQVTQAQIKELGRYGKTELLEERIESEARAKRLRSFILDVVLP